MTQKEQTPKALPTDSDLYDIMEAVKAGNYPYGKDEPHIKRLIEEATQLDERLNKLCTFLFGDGFHTINPYHQGLLTSQADIMLCYWQLLAKRLYDLKDRPR